MKKVIWLSRHEMTEEQKTSLAALLHEEIEVESRNVTWAATDDQYKDYVGNLALWAELLESANFITGVFPPVALEALPKDLEDIVYSPVSKQDPAKRVGDGPIPFVHVRWARIR